MGSSHHHHHHSSGLVPRGSHMLPHGSASFSEWQPPGPGDLRGPCPMLNTLANHGFLPHDGKNITRETLIDALGDALNFDEELANLLFDMAITTNPEPNATWFSLDHLNRHNILEHDASLSRADAYFGNAHTFNQTIFDETRSYWTGDILDPNMLANARIARQLNSKATNPTYTFTETTEQFSVGETAAFIIVLGDRETGTAPRTFVEYFFENERLPYELGWTRPEEPITSDDLARMTDMIGNATSLITVLLPGSEAAAAATKMVKRGVHAGF